MMRLHRVKPPRLRIFAAGERGAAAVEFAMVLGLLIFPVLNVVDLAYYAFSQMQTQNAAQMGAQAAFSDCDTANSTPATTACVSTNSANSMTVYDSVAQAIQESALGNSVTLATTGGITYVSEGYYCANASNTLLQVTSSNIGYAYSDGGADSINNANSPPTMPSGVSDCSGTVNASDSTSNPGDFVKVTVTHTFTSIFPYASIASLLPSTMTGVAYVRIS
jgi:Flp pilus assembly protein TadG